MPEIALGYLVGFLLTAGLVALHVFLQLRKLKSAEMILLQKNLKRINLFWSESESAVKDYAEGIDVTDKQKNIRSILISGTGFSVLSWLGLSMQFILMLSLRYLAVKRIELRLFESDLALKELSPEISREILKKLMPT